MINNKEIVDLLLCSGADMIPGSPTKAMHAACYQYNYQMFEYLIQKGADISTQYRLGKTPLSLLFRNFYYSYVILMIKEFAKMTFENIEVFQMDLS